MFCNQCEQASGGVGCQVTGVCGKEPAMAAFQDLLLENLKGIAVHVTRARQNGRKDDEIDRFMLDGIFSTVTNVDFDPWHLNQMVRKSMEFKGRARTLELDACGLASNEPVLNEKGVAGLPQADADIRSVVQILLYGLKGVASYAHHAALLGRSDEEVLAFIHRALASTTDATLGLEDFLRLAMECGRINLRTMEMLNEAHVAAYGHPVPTRVNLGTRAGKGILVSGHDLKMLETLLQQTEGTGIMVYTHGEMLPAHGYPGLSRYKHLAGHFGTAWQNQAHELLHFPGAIIFNTNCIQRPNAQYENRLFTWGQVSWPGIAHLEGWDFRPVIDRALSLPDLPDAPGQEITVGFGHNAVLGVADQVIAAVKSGKIRHFFLIGGCDGAKSGRNYYTELAENVPDDCVILTLACGKFRFNLHEFGDIGGIPRLLDVGQCNDAYSAIRIASALADAFGCGVNELPLSMILSWYEQKAVAILLTLFHLGIKNIKLGPTLPAFITPNVLSYLVTNFGVGPITTARADLAAVLGEPVAAR